ncbi:MAG: FRG domain-containing protein [Desulfovibrio sp.]|uniref:FRG domain-containing protein n=1 Tax=Desulfovibrio sp. TaxID=885 RepID=UPI001A75DFE6|nr:FRG domain-containing protein [Desulfovibrio sp.]MBD5416840.1 FRG domain-containing protein [Desulfovibrio sp.]
MPVFEDDIGIKYKKLKHWKNFITFVEDIKDAYQYIWRGQSNCEWDLVSSFDRLFNDEFDKGDRKRQAEKHLARFKYIAKGYIEYDDVCVGEDDEMWALAQHYGLATPLLDWTYSPFVALFFAIHNLLFSLERTISIWGLGNLMNCNIIASQKEIPIIKRFHPEQRKNPRLINQNGLFTKIPYGYSLNEWITQCTQDASLINLFKIDIEFRDKEIEQCLIFLNRMNINYYTLFPDAEGVTKFCNMAFRIDKYHRFW